MPDSRPQDPVHSIMWDYKVGLVRTTAFFKSLEHSKVGLPNRVLGFC